MKSQDIYFAMYLGEVNHISLRSTKDNRWKFPLIFAGILFVPLLTHRVPMSSVIVSSSLTLTHEPATYIKIPKCGQPSVKVFTILKGGISGLWTKLHPP